MSSSVKASAPVVAASRCSRVIIRVPFFLVDHTKFDSEAKIAAAPQMASLRARHLEGAVLIGAVLRNVDFEGASLKGAALLEARLQGASLDNAESHGTP
jgi:Pentapeptide repeats (8 copies)